MRVCNADNKGFNDTYPYKRVLEFPIIPRVGDQIDLATYANDRHTTLITHCTVASVVIHEVKATPYDATITVSE